MKVDKVLIPMALDCPGFDCLLHAH